MHSTSNAQDTLSQLRAGKLHGIKRLDLSCGLTTFPEEIFDLAPSLEVLNLTGNHLKSLPDDLTRLKNLQTIFCSENQFDHVPEVLGQCKKLTMVGFKANKIKHLPNEAIAKNLRWLILTDNALREIPDSIGDCFAMQKLMLAGNQLKNLPEALANCRHLELLRISANQFEKLPTFLLDMPRLAWLALAGNPMNQAQEKAAVAQNQLLPIAWKALKLGQPLGEGASGIIYQATFSPPIDHANGQLREAVAVKLFKGNVTSDGLPESEMAAWFGAGKHANLTQVKGQLFAHPTGTQGLIMPLIDAGFKILANPPSLSSCTRDVYAPERNFSLKQALNIALCIAKATAYLHQQGILHGDLYAHNILHNADKVLLSDFGGAAFLPQNDGATSKKLQQIEVLAFANLLEELTSRCVDDASAPSAHNALLQIQLACCNPVVASRPLFNEIVQRLEQVTI